jgi:NTP pyrophosphatase (non-canonical NTP hydrolase)
MTLNVKTAHLNDLADECHRIAVSKGFWDGSNPVPQKLCLMHSEISEALEEFRAGHPVNAIRLAHPSGKPEGFPIELADLLIRVLDTCAAHGIDIANAVEMKMKYNATRPVKHNKCF